MTMTPEHATRTKVVADCAWCGAEFANIVELLTHVEALHLEDLACAA